MSESELHQRSYQTQVSEVLTKLEELTPHIERTRRDRWMSRFRNLMAFVALIAFILAGMALIRVGAVDRQQAAEASRQAASSQRISECINNVLGIRAVTTTRETEARKQYAEAQERFARGQTEAFRLIFARSAANAPLLIQAAQDGNLPQVLRHLSKEPNTGNDLLLKVEDQFKRDSRHFVLELNSIQAFRNQHPLGEC